MLYGILDANFLSTSELLYPNMKIRLRLVKARPSLYMISDNPNISLGVVDCSLYTRRIALKDDYHKKRTDMLAYTPMEFNYLEILAKTSIIPARSNQIIQEIIFNNAPVRRLLLQRIQTLHSLDLILKIHSGINNLISDKIEYSEEVNQL